MSHSPHQIRRLVFEAGLRGRERSTVLQNRISVFSRSRLEAVLAESLAPLAGDYFLAFGKVELDLGEISFSRLEDDLAAGIVRSLREWAVRARLMHTSGSVRPTPGAEEPADRVAMAGKKLPQGEDDSASAIDAVVHFLEWGMLPDSVLRAPGYSAEFAMMTALAHSPEEVCAAIRRLGEKQPVRRRLAGQFSGSAIQCLVSALDPVNAPWMVLSIRFLEKLHAERPFVPLQSRAFSRLLWELALEYLPLHNWRALNPASFLRFLLQKLAARQKASYEVLLADVALRRGWEPEQGQVKETGLQSQITTAIVALLEEDVFGVQLAYAPRFVVRPAFQHLYSDLDVLAYWLRWRKLPSWSFAPSADEMAGRLGPLLRQLPREVRQSNEQAAAAAVQSQTPARMSGSDLSFSAVQLERWLLYGLWPQEVAHPQNAALANWLERQDQSIWLTALRSCGAQEQAVHRMVHHLPEAHLLKIARLITGADAQLTCSYIQSLWSLEPKLTGASLPGWRQQVSRYALLHLLQAASRGPAPILVEVPARVTLQALSLRYQISYDRLLQLLQQENSHFSRLRTLIGALQAEWKQRSARTEILFEPSRAAVPDGSGIVLHYLKYGSLPDTAPALSLRALRRLAESLNDRQRSSLSELAQDQEIAHRISILFPAGANIEVLQVQREEKPEFSAETNVEALQTRSGMKDGGPAEASGAKLLSRETRFGDPAREPSGLKTSLSEAKSNDPVTEISGAKLLPGETGFGDPVAGQGLKPLPQAMDQGREKEGENEFEAKDPLRHRLDALAWLLRNGEVPWWGEELLRQPSEIWFESLLESSPGLLLQMLRAAASTPQAIDRLIQYVPAGQLEGLVQQAVPGYGGLLILYIEVGRTLAESNLLRSHSIGLHWRETLLCVLDESSSALTPANALRRLCNSVSQQLDLALDHYLQLLLQQARTKTRMAGQSGYGALAEMLSQMRLPVTSVLEKVRTNPQVGNEVLAPDSLGHKAAEGQPSGAQVGLSADELSYEAIPSVHATSVNKARLPGAIADNGERAAPDNVPDREKTGVPVRKETGVPVEMDAAQENGATSSKSLALPDESAPAVRLEHLLRYGVLPPALKTQDLGQFMETLAADLRSRPEEYRSYLMAAISRDVERKRIVRLFSEEALGHLWPILLPSDHVQAVFWMKELSAAAAQSSAAAMKDHLLHTCIEELLRAVNALRGSRWDSAAYLRAATQRLVEEHSLRSFEIVERLRTKLLRQPKRIQEESRPTLDRLERDTAFIPVEVKTPAQSEAAAEFKAESSLRKESQKPASKLPSGEPFYIQNAGAVLLWPFLDRYFRTLGLLEQNAFRGEAERNRAIHLVQYLATGTLETAEHELLLNKVLCGAPAEDPLDAVDPVTGEEESLSTQLLRGVIANWTKLRNTSIAGLRQSFLVREGRMLHRDSDDAWSLTVSAKAYDMLLDSLPWRFSTIRLPWMQTVLHVKWR